MKNEECRNISVSKIEGNAECPGFAEASGMQKRNLYAIGGSASDRKHSAFYILHSSFLPGFTLVEIMVVMSVIIVLVAMLFPVVIGSRDKARRKQALTQAHTVVLALKAYRNEFGTWPNQDQGGEDTTYFTNNHKVILPLIGDNARGKIFLSIQLAASNSVDGQAFISGQTDAVTNLIDPWGVPYVICLDEDMSGSCLISVSNVYYYNILSSPPSSNYYLTGSISTAEYPVANVDVAVASFTGLTNRTTETISTRFDVETWSEAR